MVHVAFIIFVISKCINIWWCLGSWCTLE